MSDDRGFTLPEVLVAGTLTLLLALPALHLLRTTYRIADTVQGRLRLNEQARQVFALLADGQSPASQTELANAAGYPRFPFVEGLHSRQLGGGNVPQGSALRTASQFVLRDGTLSLAGDLVGPLRITCTGPQTPIPDCTAAGDTKTVQGWLGSDPVLTPPSAAVGPGRTAALSITLTNPFQAPRAVGAVGASERYRTMMTLNVEANP